MQLIAKQSCRGTWAWVAAASCRRAQGGSWAAVRGLDDGYWATLADGEADEAQTEAREVIGAGELKCACMTKSAAVEAARRRVDGERRARAIAASTCLPVESSSNLNSWE